MWSNIEKALDKGAYKAYESGAITPEQYQQTGAVADRITSGELPADYYNATGSQRAAMRNGVDVQNSPFWNNVSNALNQGAQKAQAFRDDNWANGVDIVHIPNRWPEKSIDAKSNLQTGLNISIDDTEIPGGIAGMRYLGKTVNDVYNPEYFSTVEASDRYSPLQVSLSDYSNMRGNNPTAVGSFTVYYDGNGSIAEIDADSDVIFKNGKKYRKGVKIADPVSISDFFKDMEIASEGSDYYIQNRLNGNGGRFGGAANRTGSIGAQAPTTIFGSQGVLSNNIKKSPIQYNRHAWNQSFAGKPELDNLRAGIWGLKSMPKVYYGADYQYEGYGNNVAEQNLNTINEYLKAQQENRPINERFKSHRKDMSNYGGI